MNAPARPGTLLGWRLLALSYDFWPALALSMACAAIALLLHHNAPLQAFSPGQWLLWLVCWLLTGTYAVLSWRRGGQTLGMRPWRLHATGIDGAPATTAAWMLRYGVGTISLLLLGAGFWWAWIDRDRLTWHDRASGTRLRRIPRPD